MIRLVISHDQDAFGDDTCREISQLDADTLRLITEIELQSCGITETGIVYLRRAISKMRRLAELHLENNLITDSGVKMLSECLELNDVHVCLGDNPRISEQMKDALLTTGRMWL